MGSLGPMIVIYWNFHPTFATIALKLTAYPSFEKVQTSESKFLGEFLNGVAQPLRRCASSKLGAVRVP
jgi:hypothetical protein